LTSSFASRRE
jgi:MFS family permease